MEASKCPKCGDEPFYIEHIEKWYCYGCNSYIEETEQEHVCAPAPAPTDNAKAIAAEISALDEETKVECKNCGAELEGLKDGRLYCFMCETYQDEVGSKCEEKAARNEAQELLDSIVPAPETAPNGKDAAEGPHPAPELAAPTAEAGTKIEPAPEVRLCTVCGQPLKYIDKYSRYYCYGCRKYAPKDGIQSEHARAVPSAKMTCPYCGGDLKFVDKYSEYYCYTCRKYPFHKKKTKDTPVSVAVGGGEMRCPKCGGALKWIEKYSRHYCYACKQYAPKGQHKGASHPAEKKVCPACHGSMKYIPEYSEWYCYKCRKYSLRPSKPVLLM